MRALPALHATLTRSGWQSFSPNCGYRWTLLRHGSQRTVTTPHYDPQDWTRDRTQTIRPSLYHHPGDWSEEPLYPEIEPIKDTPEWVRFMRRHEAKVLEQLPLKQKMNYFSFAPHWKRTIPQKRMHDNRRRFWKPYEISGFPDLYNVTPFYQYITNTAVVSDKLPAEYYSFLDDAALLGIVEKIREPVRQALLAERTYFKNNLQAVPESDREGVVQAQNVVDAITRCVDLVAGKDFPHLSQVQRDLDTRCAAFWKRTGFEGEGPSDHMDPVTGELHQEVVYFTSEPVSGEMRFQYVEDGLIFRLFRHELPLPPVVPRTSSSLAAAKSDAAALDVTPETQSPSTRGFEAKQYIPHWIPGFWFGDPCEFSTLSLTVPRKWTAVADRLGDDAVLENLVGTAVMSGFGRIVAQAMYLGFSLLNELTYPIVTQSILTNGRDWIFSTYQANTIAVWQRDSDNPHRNLAWITPRIRLFDEIEGNNVIGLNDEVLKNIVRQYLKAPHVDPAINLRPFVGEPIRSYWKTETSTVPFYHRVARRDGKPRAPYRPEI